MNPDTSFEPRSSEYVYLPSLGATVCTCKCDAPWVTWTLDGYRSTSKLGKNEKRAPTKLIPYIPVRDPTPVGMIRIIRTWCKMLNSIKRQKSLSRRELNPGLERDKLTY